MSSTTANARSAANIACEFVVGITGHRDIADVDQPKVAALLREVLQQMQARFTHLPVRILTGLAEGADTLAAEVALELGMRVSAILPMPIESYQRDFGPRAIERFRSLAADSRVSVHAIPMIGGAPDAALENPTARDAQYRALANYLTRRANVLLAVWDGEVTNLPGGTSDVVLSYLGNGRSDPPTEIAADPSASADCGNALLWIPARRASNLARIVPEGVQYLVSNASYDCFWAGTDLPMRIAERWDGFDAYAAERQSPIGKNLIAYGLAEDGKIDSADLNALDAEFVRADQLARAYQLRSDQMFALFGFLAAAMGLAFLVYAKLMAEQFLLIGYIALFAIGFLGFRYSARRHLHGKHLAYRALAETLRVQYFLVLSGAGETYDLRRILTLTSVDRFKRFEWLQEAIRSGEPLVYSGHCPDAVMIDLIRERWIEDQSRYFSKRLKHLHAHHKRLEKVKAALLAGSVIGALALILFKKSLLHLEMVGYDGKAWLVFFMGLLPLWVAIWELYQGKMATHELLWQYSNQHRYFNAANREIGEAVTAASGRRIIRDLADKALMEIYLWSVHRYHREHEPPAAG